MIKISCNLPKHIGQLWSAVESFMPAYPTSIRVTQNDLRGLGNR